MDNNNNKSNNNNNNNENNNNNNNNNKHDRKDLKPYWKSEKRLHFSSGSTILLFTSS